jgi:HPt (histidine-containing phosphotransfer) domain-containing protein
MSKPKVEFIDPREAAPRAVQLGKPVFDAKAVSRADETLKAMSGSFGEWLDGDIAKLQAARMAGEAAQWSDHSLQLVFAAAHDLKGMGATYGFPLVTQLAASLCRLTETDAGKDAARANPSLVTAHVDALRAAARDQITSTAHPIGRALVQALEAHVDMLGVAPE